LFGEKPTGGKLELLIERVLGGNQVAAHMRVSKKPLSFLNTVIVLFQVLKEVWSIDLDKL
jgi:hypothetical protein